MSRLLASTAIGVGFAFWVSGCVDRPESELATSAPTIMDVQGDGPRSPLDGERVRISGIVTAARSDGRGFWIQDPSGDDDPETSDAILIWDRARVRLGDRVRVTGSVKEFVGRDRDRSLTEIVDVTGIDTVSAGEAIPKPVLLEPLPDVSIEDAIRYWSRLEGMRVRIDRATVVGPTNRFGEMVAVMASNGPVRSHVFVRPLADGRVDYNPERVILDDAIIDAVTARPGDELVDLVGIVDYNFGNYKVQLESVRASAGERVVARPRTLGGTAIASFNVENLLPGEGRDLDRKLDALSHYVREILRLPEILALQEVGDETIARELAKRINVAAQTRYGARSLGSSDGRGIENAFLYDEARVSLAGAELIDGPLVEIAFGPDSPSPGREPLVGRFDVGASRLIVIGNHFKSKGGDDPLFGAVQPPERSTERQRKAQARAVRAYVEDLLAEDPDAFVVVAGDFNDFQFAEPSEGASHPLAILEGEAPRLLNLITTLDNPYTFIFEGNAQVLDHLLVSPALLDRVAGFEIVHGNADAPRAVSDHDPPLVRLRLP